MPRYMIPCLLLLLACTRVCATPRKSRSNQVVAHVSASVASILRSAADQRAITQSDALVASGGPPKMPEKWVAHVNQTMIVNGTPMTTQLPFPTGNALPTLASDSIKKRMIYQYHFRFAYAPAEYVGTPNEWFNSTSFITDTFAGVMMNNNKYNSTDKPDGGMFQDLFAWVPFAVDGGMVTFKGKKLQRWTLKSGSAEMELLTDANGMPVLSVTNTTGSSQSMEFQDFVANAEIPGVWDGFSEEAFRTPLLCPGSSHVQVEKTTMYIFHPKNEFNISGQDLGDSTGDVFFTCTDIMDGQSPQLDHNYAWLTQWEIELVPTWGQYQNCNGYNPPQCLSANHFWVGRESSNYIGSTNATERQCGPTNPLVGAWWSLPPAGRCGPGQRPGDGSCTWRERRVKTIDGKCLFQDDGNGFKAACERDGRGPFPSAAVLFLEAFASDDPSQGGCPNVVPIQPAACSWNQGCVGLTGDCCPTLDGTMLSCCEGVVPSQKSNFSSLII